MTPKQRAIFLRNKARAMAYVPPDGWVVITTTPSDTRSQQVFGDEQAARSYLRSLLRTPSRLRHNLYHNGVLQA